MKRIKLLVTSAIMAMVIAPVYGAQIVSPNVNLNSTTYDMIDSLHAQGYIDTLPTSKPYSRLQVAEWVQEANGKVDANTPQFVQSMLQNLETEYADDIQTLATGKQESKVVVDSATVSVTSTNSPEYNQNRGGWVRTASTYQPLNSNNNGYKYNRGTTVSGEVNIRGTAGNHVAYAITPRADLFAGDNSARLVNGYVKTHIGAVEVQAGKDELWWGPMHQSSLNLSNNMNALTGVKVTTINPVKVGGTFRFLRSIKPTFVYAKMSDNRNDVKHPNFVGARVEVAPTKRLVIGASLTSIMGGAGRHLSLSDYGRFLTGKNEASRSKDKWNSIAGYDIKWTLPSMEVYGMVYGEDQATGLGFIPSPSKIAWTAGVYLPKLGNHDDWNLRLEGGRTSNWWYAHWSYNDGYVHKGNIIGDYMGNSSNRLYARLGHWDKKANLTGFNVEYLRLNRELNTNAKALNVWVDHSRKLSNDWSLAAKIGVSRLHNMTDKKDKTAYLVGVDVKRTF